MVGNVLINKQKPNIVQIVMYVILTVSFTKIYIKIKLTYYF